MKKKVIVLLVALALLLSAVPFALAAGGGDDYDKNYKVTTVKDVKSGDAVIGAVLQILDADKKVVEEWTTTKEDHELTSVLIAGATYTLHEKNAPDGYILAVDVTFTVSDDGKEDTITMYDNYTRVSIKKIAK